MYIQSLRARRILRSLPYPAETYSTPTVVLEDDSRVLPGLLNGIALAAACWSALGVVIYMIYSFALGR